MNTKATSTKHQEKVNESIGVRLLQVLIQEVKLMKKPWEAMSEKQQNATIDRFRDSVAFAVRSAVHEIASDGRITVVADLSNVTITDDIKATLKVSRANPFEALQGLYSSHNKACLLVVATPEDYTQGMIDVKGESDQRAMDLGQEYAPNGEGFEDVLDAEVKAITHDTHEADTE